MFSSFFNSACHLFNFLFLDVIYTIDPSEHENILVNCFSVLIQVPFNFKLENAVVSNFLVLVFR